MKAVRNIFACAIAVLVWYAVCLSAINPVLFAAISSAILSNVLGVYAYHIYKGRGGQKEAISLVAGMFLGAIPVLNIVFCTDIIIEGCIEEMKNGF